MRSNDIGIGAYAGGRYLARWTLVGGYPRCALPPLALSDSTAGAVADAIAVNRAVAAIAARAEAVEAASLLAAQDPPPETIMAPGPGLDDPPVAVPNPAWAMWDAAVALLADAASDTDLQHLLRTRAGALAVDEWGQPAEGAWALTLPPVPALDPLSQTADWDGTGWAVRDLTVEEEAGWPLQPPPVPATVTGTQLRVALIHRGLLAAVEGAVAQADDPEVTVRWAAGVMERSSPLLIEMAGALGLTQADIDDIFRQAAGL